MTNPIALFGGNIITMDPQNPFVHGVFIEDGKITATGSTLEMRHLAMQKKCPRRDLHGKTLIPGLHDAHVHIMGTGQNAIGHSLYDATCIQDVLDLLETAVQESTDSLICGVLLDESRLAEKRPPTATELDRISGDKDLYLVDRGLHYSLVNTALLNKLAFKGDEEGLMKDPDGHPNGRLHSQANAIAKDFYNHNLSEAQREACIQFTVSTALAHGITTLHGMEGGALFSDLDIATFKRLMPTLPLEIVLYWDTPDLDKIEAAGFSRMGTDLLLDGSIGSRTAAFDAPYADDPSTTGTLYYSQDFVNTLVLNCFERNLQCGFHAIGQRGIRMALNALEYALEKYPKKDHRFRIEHFGFPDASDILRAKKCGAIISTQPAFAYLRGGPGSVYALRTGPERERNAYSNRRYMDAGLTLCGGSDSGVTPMNPLLGIHAAVNPPYPENAITPHEALEMFTCNAAYAAFQDDIKGSISVGKQADFTLLDQNPLTVDPMTIKDIDVLETIVKGQTVYTHKGFKK